MQRFNDELFELGLVHGGAVDPVVAALPSPLDSLEDAGLPHVLEEREALQVREDARRGRR